MNGLRKTHLGTVLVLGLLCSIPGLAAQAADFPMAPPDTQMVALVTGSTSGLGREVALRLAAGGAHVIIHGRDQARGEAVVAEIQAMGIGSARFYQADFASLENVRTLAAAIQQDYQRLDLLVNNAGLSVRGTQTPQLTQDGHELLLQVNYLSHVLLTDLLLPMLRASAPARIIHVASLAQQPMDFDDPNMHNNFSSGRSYGQSKLAQITFSNALAERLADSGVITLSLHPGTMMPTRMVLGAGIEPQDSLEVGIDAVMQLVTLPDPENGAYYNRQEKSRAHPQAYDEAAQATLWQLSRQLVGLE